jgi:hypothetical protein
LILTHLGPIDKLREIHVSKASRQPSSGRAYITVHEREASFDGNTLLPQPSFVASKRQQYIIFLVL